MLQNRVSRAADNVANDDDDDGSNDMAIQIPAYEDLADTPLLYSIRDETLYTAQLCFIAQQ
jgi:hypothetical protein